MTDNVSSLYPNVHKAYVKYQNALGQPPRSAQALIKFCHHTNNFDVSIFEARKYFKGLYKTKSNIQLLCINISYILYTIYHI